MAINTSLPEQIDDLLPQTQCRKCGYPGCLPYAQAVGNNEAKINLCAPGGEQVVKELSELLGISVETSGQPSVTAPHRLVAVIDESACIGCAKCLPPCPVDAILGAAKHMHTIIAGLCTGCELCIEPCPVDCIQMIVSELPAWSREDALQAKARFEKKNRRIAVQETENQERLLKQKQRLELMKKTKP
ncbi:MAG: RnfABCDGE type electron transport complex subunit B [Methylomonas sp.]|jgi:electron transport complex protein RnfB